jgi:glucose-fructose oxidoreductase
MTNISTTRRRLLAGLGGASALWSLPWRGGAKTAERTLGVAIVGLGGYAEGLIAPGLGRTRHCRLAGIVTGTPDKVPAWQQRHGIADANVYSYDSFDRIADNPAIDVVYIITPPHLHKSLAVRAANAGKHVWCEKPMAMNADECQQMIQACRRNKVALAIGYRMQHEPNTRTLMGYATSRPFGRLREVRAEAGYAGYDIDDLRPRNWRLARAFGGGPMYDMGTYPLNAARYTVGAEPLAVSARARVDRPAIFDEVEEYMDFTLEFPDEVRATCATSFGRSMNQLRATCAEGWYELAPFQSYTGVRGQRSDGRRLEAVVEHQQALQMDNDALAILRGTPLRVPGEEGARDLRIMDAIFRSAREDGRRIVL